MEDQIDKKIKQRSRKLESRSDGGIAKNNRSIRRNVREKMRQYSKAAKTELHNHITYVLSSDLVVPFPSTSGQEVSHDPFQDLNPIQKRIVALDCEMVGIGPKNRSALARCSIVNYLGDVIFDEYIRPDGPITRYRTWVSGIRPYHMVDALPMAKAVVEIKKILQDKIIVGHDLKNDFLAIGLSHPESLRRDTAKYCPIREYARLPVHHSPSLKKLSLILLDREIQRRSHCSVQDAIAALDVYKLFEPLWEYKNQSKPAQTDSKYLTDEYWPKDIVSSSERCTPSTSTPQT